jgi:hypothetical protein
MSQPSKPTWAFAAEGARLGITSCPTCGAAIVLNQFDDNLKIHEDWHKRSRNNPIATDYSSVEVVPQIEYDD